MMAALPAIPAIVSGLGSILGGIFGGNDEPDYSALYREQADQYGQQANPIIKEYLAKALGLMQPYEQLGRGALEKYRQASQEMIAPDFINQQMQGYQMSPWAQNQLKQGQEAISSSAYARGLGGSTAQGRNLLDYSQGLTSRDMQRYLQNKMAARQYGMEGLGTIGGRGQQAAGQMGAYNIGAGQSLLDVLRNQAAMRNQGILAQQEQNQQRAEQIGSMFPAIGNIMSQFQTFQSPVQRAMNTYFTKQWGG